MKRTICLLLFFLLLPLSSPALANSTIQWTRPADGDILYQVFYQPDGMAGLKDMDGNVLLEPIYKSIDIGTEAILVQDQQNQYGYLRPDGSWIVQPTYDYGAAFDQGVAVVGRDFGYTLLNLDGAELIPLQPVRPESYEGRDYYKCSYDGQTTIWDTAGQQVAQLPYETTWMAGLSAIGIIADGKQGVAKADGAILLPAVYDLTDIVRTGTSPDDICILRAVQGDSRYWFRMDGTQIGDTAWSETGIVSAIAGTIAINRDGKEGLMDMNGTVILEPAYEDVYIVTGHGYTNADIVAVKQNGKTGLLKWDGTGYQTLIPPRWASTVKPNYMSRMGDGSIAVACVRDYGDGLTELRYGLVGEDGSILLEPVYGYINWNDEMSNLIVKDADGNAVLDPPLGQGYTDELLCEEPVRPEIAALQQAGILKGDTSGDLRLWDNISRAEFLALLARAEAWEIASGAPSPFSDTAGHWAEDIITAAAQKGLVQGADGQFRPDDPVTYDEGFRIVLRAFGVPDEQLAGQLVLDSVAHAAGIDLYPASHGSAWPLPREQAAKLIYDYLHTDATPEDVYNHLYPVVE